MSIATATAAFFISIHHSRSVNFSSHNRNSVSTQIVPFLNKNPISFVFFVQYLLYRQWIFIDFQKFSKLDCVVAVVGGRLLKPPEDFRPDRKLNWTIESAGGGGKITYWPDDDENAVGNWRNLGYSMFDVRWAPNRKVSSFLMSDSVFLRPTAFRWQSPAADRLPSAVLSVDFGTTLWSIPIRIWIFSIKINLLLFKKTCVSDNPSRRASKVLCSPTKYGCEQKVFSNASSCHLAKAVRLRFGRSKSSALGNSKIFSNPFESNTSHQHSNN